MSRRPDRRTCLLSALGLLAGSLALPSAAYDPEQAGFEFNRALYRHYSQDHLSAASSILQHARKEALGTDARLLLTDNLLSYGLYREALREFRALIAEGELSAKVRAGLWLKFARYEYERGYFDAAEATLTEMRVDVGGRRQRTERATLLAQIQLIKGRADDAVETLLSGRAYAKNDFARYNLGMAFIASNDIRRGRRELDKLGLEVVNDPTEHALRDRANLALAYNYLAEAKGASARPVLQRIRLEGPYSDEALLGLGWAEIAADKADDIRLSERQTDDTIGGVIGDILRPGQVNDDIRSRLGMLRVRTSPETEEERFRKALIPWLELDRRDPKNPAVLEVQLAIPYALDALGETDRARRFYERAVSRLEQARTGLDKAMDGILSGRMIETMIRRDRDREAGWNWRLRDLPDAAETYYLAEVLAEHSFQESLKNYRDLKQLQRRLARQRASLNEHSRGQNRVSVPPSELFRQKLAGQPPLWQGIQPALKLESSLGRFPRNETLEGLLAWTYRYAPKIDLNLVGAPRDFVSAPSQSIQTMTARIDDLLMQINQVIREQRKLLENIAVAAMQQHKSTLTRYLIDARFALARLYDQVDKGETQE